MKTPSSFTPQASQPPGPANLNHDGSSTRPRTSTVPNQLTLQGRTDDVFQGVRRHQPAESSIDVTSVRPYHQVTRSWASKHPTQRTVNGSNRQEMTSMDRWISQDTKDEMWNDVHGVYGTYGQPDGVNAVEDGSVRTGGS